MRAEWQTKEDLIEIRRCQSELAEKLERQLSKVNEELVHIDFILNVTPTLDTPRRNRRKGKVVGNGDNPKDRKLIANRERVWRKHATTIVKAMQDQPKMWRQKKAIVELTGLQDYVISAAVTHAELIGAIERHPDDPVDKAVGARFRLSQKGSVMVIKPGEGVIH
jgi:hypothetical protein